MAYWRTKEHGKDTFFIFLGLSPYLTLPELGRPWPVSQHVTTTPHQTTTRRGRGGSETTNLGTTNKNSFYSLFIILYWRHQPPATSNQSPASAVQYLFDPRSTLYLQSFSAKMLSTVFSRHQSSCLRGIGRSFTSTPVAGSPIDLEMLDVDLFRSVSLWKPMGARGEWESEAERPCSSSLN